MGFLLIKIWGCVMMANEKVVPLYRDMRLPSRGCSRY